jgi:predicted PurR-regulated permease PerM
MEPLDDRKFSNILFVILLGGVTLLSILLLKPFFFPLFWAAILASLFSLFYQKIEGKFHRPNLSATVTILVILILIILPAMLVASLLLAESVQLYDALNATESTLQAKIAKITNEIKGHPYFRAVLSVDEAFWTTKFAEIAKSIANYILTTLQTMTQNTLILLVQFAVMAYTLFFFIRDGERLLKTAIDYLPLGQEREKILYERFTSTARATLKTILIIGGLQGLLGAGLFFFLGIDGALTWGVIMTVMSIVPGVGSTIVWAPAALIMLFTGHYWEGATILAFGALVISMVDNLLRPVLLGKDIQMHPLLIFLSTLGGIMLFGISGFVLGPMIIAFFLTIWGFRHAEHPPQKS